MVRKQKRAKVPKLGKQDRWPSDYGVRDTAPEATADRATQNDEGWTRDEKGHGGEGQSKGFGGSGGQAKGRSGPDPKAS